MLKNMATTRYWTKLYKKRTPKENPHHSEGGNGVWHRHSNRDFQLNHFAAIIKTPVQWEAFQQYQSWSGPRNLTKKTEFKFLAELNLPNSNRDEQKNETRFNIG